MNKLIYACFLSLFALGASDCSREIKPDPEMSAVQGNDLTGLIDGSQTSGCGTQLQSGLMFCRVSERQSAEQEIYFVGPANSCDREDSCVFIKVFFPTGEPALEINIPKKETRVGVAWKDLIKKDQFEKDDRGFWPYIYEVHWKDTDGRARVSVSEGLIYLRVLDNGYKPLHESKENEHFVWSQNYDGALVRVTSGMRTYVGKK